MVGRLCQPPKMAFHRNALQFCRQSDQCDLAKIDKPATLLAMTDEPVEPRFHGGGVSPGIARGGIQVMRDELEEIDRYSIAPSRVSAEIARFESALVQTRIRILEMQRKIAG